MNKPSFLSISRRLVFFFCLIFSSLFLTCLSPDIIRQDNFATSAIKVIPQPRTIKFNQSPCILNKQFIILLASTHNEYDRISAETLQKDLKETWNREIKIVVDDDLIDRRSHKVIVLGLPHRDQQIAKRCIRRGVLIDDWLDDEGYLLTVNKDEVIVVANHSRGLFYGVQTLRQLIEKRHHELVLPGITIRDWPVYRYRGFQLDLTNNPLPRLAYLKAIIRDLAFYKINLLMLYTEHTIALKKYSDIAPADDILTADEVRDLVNYARQHQIDLVGNLPAFRFNHVLQLPAYAHLADNPETKEIISPTIPASYDFLKDLFAEIIPLYSLPGERTGSKFFCINCEEPTGLEKGKSASQIMRMGPEKVYLQHFDKLLDLLNPYYRRIMILGDMALKYQKIISQLPKDIIILNSAFGKDPSRNYRKSIALFQDAGLEQFICPATASSQQIFPLLSYTLKNIQLSLKEGAQKLIPGETKGKIIGTLLCSGWNNDGEGVLEADWLSIAWFAECAWLPERSNEARFKSKFTHTFYGVSDNKASQIMELLDQPNLILNRSSIACDALRETSFAAPTSSAIPSMNQVFWEDPFASRWGLTVVHFSNQLQKIAKVSEQALKLIDQLKWKARRHKESLNYLAYVARRWKYLSRKFVLSEQLSRDYRDIYSEFRHENEVVLHQFAKWEKFLRILSQELNDLQQEHLQFWKERYRSYLLADNQEKFNKLAVVYQDKIVKLQKTYREFPLSGFLPPPDQFNFEQKTFPHKNVIPVIIPPEPVVSKRFTWWDPAWHYRLLIKWENKPASNKQCSRFNYPLEVRLNFSELLEEMGIRNEEFDLNSIRVIEYDPLKCIPVREIPYQFNKRTHFNTKYYADCNLAWIIPGLSTVKATSYFYIYFDTLKDGTKQKPQYRIKGLKTYPGKNGSYWIENERIKVHLNSKGALITQWRTGGSEKLDIISAQDAVPAGGYDSTVFNLICEIKGPLITRYRALATNEAYSADSSGRTCKTITFYENLPICEVIMSTGIPSYRNYDCFEVNPANKFIFSNYFTGTVPSREMSYIKQDDTNWCAKWDKYGLTIGCITPDTKVTHYLGLNEIGVAKAPNQPLVHFLIYADITSQDTFHLFNQLRSTFTLLDQPLLQRGRVEKK